MPEQDTVTWNILISGYNRNGFPNQALYLYSQMIDAKGTHSFQNEKYHPAAVAHHPPLTMRLKEFNLLPPFNFFNQLDIFIIVAHAILRGFPMH
ncbi:hypothetical protein RJ640_000201 [Escallonia rubra]|uniref:Pentatricopeptide repeat-containing protein n=1 Tax=Escallonia rubra TaxID=112253 RepID=A0AA88QV79_9ASTE|nr:hypothetical protein RJ640_000201 [Escallonia rubra]